MVSSHTMDHVRRWYLHSLEIQHKPVFTDLISEIHLCAADADWRLKLLMMLLMRWEVRWKITFLCLAWLWWRGTVACLTTYSRLDTAHHPLIWRWHTTLYNTVMNLTLTSARSTWTRTMQIICIRICQDSISIIKFCFPSLLSWYRLISYCFYKQKLKVSLQFFIWPV